MADSKQAIPSRRIRRELRTVRAMIALYCRAHHETHGEDLCPECRELWDYARQRVEQCPFGPEKPTCLNCAVHCFKPQRREQIRKIMRFSGPRMAWRHPLWTVCHFIDGRRPTPLRVEPPRSASSGRLRSPPSEGEPWAPSPGPPR
ncbi:MAG: nitrous oxide-stimulated promoter family protein [Deltaproteobacteria bacterium]|nr:nitrous oxide-stimulated promoter family protein [Deltaproteobacteria bacterium]